MPRQKGVPSQTTGPRGSESSRILARRQAKPCNLNGDTSPLRSLHSLDAFFAEQRLRIERVTNRQIATVRAARRRQVREAENGNRREVVVESHVEVRGSCGSDVHMGSDS